MFRWKIGQKVILGDRNVWKEGGMEILNSRRTEPITFESRQYFMTDFL
jgi:hypothetical protein